MLAVKFESLPPEIHTFASLGMKAFTREEQQDIIFVRKKVDRMPDHIYVPGLRGVASVVTDCRISSLRKALTLQNMSDVVFRDNAFVGGSSEISTNRCGKVVFK